MNAIAVFVASGLVAELLGFIQVGADGTSLKSWIYDHLFVFWAEPMNQSLAFALSYVLLWLFLMWLLFRKRIFIKI